MTQAMRLDHKARVRQTFEARASSWPEYYDNAPTFRNYSLLTRKRDVLELLFSEPLTGRVLDLGCGSGDYVPSLLERPVSVWCLDGSAAMVRQVRSRFGGAGPERLHVDEGDAEALPYPDAMFDGLICVAVLEYLQDDRRALSEIHRVLKPGGVAVITVTNARSVFSCINTASYRTVRTAGAILNRLGLFEPLAGHPRMAQVFTHRLHVPSRFRSALTRAALVPEAFRYGSFGSFALNTAVPCAVPFSTACERFGGHPLFGMLGATYVVKARKPMLS